MAKSFDDIKASYIPGTISSSTNKKKKETNKKDYDSIKASSNSNVTGDTVNSFLDSSQKYLNRAYEDSSKVGYDNAKDLAYQYASDWAKLRNQSDEVRSYVNANRNLYGNKEANNIINYLDQLNSLSNNANQYYQNTSTEMASYKTKEDYDNALASAKEYYDRLSTNLGDSENEINYLEGLMNRMDTYEHIDQVLAETGYNSPSDIKDELSKKKKEYTVTKRIQDLYNAEETAKNDPDFKRYAQNASTIWKNKTDGTIFNHNGKSADPITYYRLLIKNNDPNQFPSSIDSEGNKAYKVAKDMTEDEYQTYLYYLGKEGKESADNYVSMIQDTLNYRAGQRAYNVYQGNPVMEEVYGIMQGIEGFGTQSRFVKNMLTGDDSYIPTTESQYAASMMREDLNSVGNIGGDDERSLGQMAFDLMQTTGNMLPSVMLSYFTGGLAGMATSSAVASGLSGVAQLSSAGMFGASAAGGAYQQMIQEGYSHEVATNYAVLTGASEAGLQYALGGITALGGKVPAKAIENFTAGLNNAYAKVAIGLGTNMLSEGTEEFLQDVLDPFFKEFATGEYREAIDWEEAIYSGIMGALSSIMFEFPEAKNSLLENAAIKKAYGEYQDRFIQEGLDAGDGTKASDIAKKAQEYRDKGQDLSGLLIKDLSEATDEANLEREIPEYTSYVKNELTSRGYDNAEEISSAVGKNAVGENLTRSEAELIRGNDDVLDATRQYSQMRMQQIGKEESAKQKMDDVKTSIKDRIAKDEEEATFSKILDDGKVELKDGSIVDNTKAIYKNTDQGYIVESLIRSGIETSAANAILNAYDPTINKNAMTYVLGMQEAYRYGTYNYPLSKASNNGFLSDITPSQKSAAYGYGKYASSSSVNRAISKINASVGNVAVNKGRVNFIGSAGQGLTEIQKASIATVSRVVSDITHNNVYFYQSKNVDGNIVYADNVAGHKAGEKAQNGFYQENGNIYIDINAGANSEGVILWTAAHELTHFVKQWSPEKFKKLSDFLMSEYGKKNVNVDRLVQRQYEIGLEHNKNFTYEDAFEEVVADSMQLMFTDTDMLSKLERLKLQDESLFNKVKRFIDDLFKKVSSLYKDLTPQTPEAEAVRKMKNSLEKLSDLFAEALVSAGSNYENVPISDTSSPKVSELEYKTKGTEMFQYRAMEADIPEYKKMLTAFGIDKKMITDTFNMVDKVIDKVKNNLEILDYDWELDIDDRAFNPVKPNSDPLYKNSVDFSTLCRKRILQQIVQIHLQEALNRAITKEESIAIRDELLKIQQQGREIEVACALCYVESARMKSPVQIQKFLDKRRAIITEYFATKDKENAPTQKEAEELKRKELSERYADEIAKEKTADPYEYTLTKNGDKKFIKLKALPQEVQKEIRQAKKEAKSSYKLKADEIRLLDIADGMTTADFTSPEGLAKLAKGYTTEDGTKSLFEAYTSYVRNATKSKGLEKDTWWRAGDSKAIADSLIEAMNSENGLRSQSWSDFQVIHTLDYIAAVVELSTRNAKMQVYTKVPDYVKLMGLTNQMINLSLIPEAIFDGTLRYDSVEGMPFEKALELRDKYPNAAGTICIGINNKQIEMLLASNMIDYVIPYHESGMSKVVRTVMKIPTWESYQGNQNESNVSKERAEELKAKYGLSLTINPNGDKWHKKPNFSEWFKYSDAVKAKNDFDRRAKEGTLSSAEKEMKKKYGKQAGAYFAMKQAADKYIKLCVSRGLEPKFSYGKADFSTNDAYWKLLIDRKMINQKTGEIIEQKSVIPKFKESDVLQILDDEVARYGKVKADMDYATKTVVGKFLSGDMNADINAIQKVTGAVQTAVDDVAAVSVMNTESITEKNSARDSDLREGLTEKQIENYDYNVNNHVSGSPLRTMAYAKKSGGNIERMGGVVGKNLGSLKTPWVYFHRQYLQDAMKVANIDVNDYLRAFEILKGKKPELAEKFNHMAYNATNNSFMFGFSPDFDTAREPIAGEQLQVFLDDGHTTYKANNRQIFHHKWAWVEKGYEGFDVDEAWEWSKEWLNTIRPTDELGGGFAPKGIADGTNIEAWNRQLDYFDLPIDDKRLYSARIVGVVEPITDGWRYPSVTAKGFEGNYPDTKWYFSNGKILFEDKPDSEKTEEQIKLEERNHKTQNAMTIGTYKSFFNQIKELFPDTWQEKRILDASSGLGLGTRWGQENGFNVVAIERFYSESRYGLDEGIFGDKKVSGSKEYVDAGSRVPEYTDYDGLETMVENGELPKFDIILSNMVINVVPIDQRNEVVSSMGRLLADDGILFLNTMDDKMAKGGEEIISATSTSGGEYYKNQTTTVQKGFTKDELKGYLTDVLTQYSQKATYDFRDLYEVQKWGIDGGKKGSYGTTGYAIIKNGSKETLEAFDNQKNHKKSKGFRESSKTQRYSTRETKQSADFADRILMGSEFSGGGMLEAGLMYKMIAKEFAVEYDEKIAKVYSDNWGEHIYAGKDNGDVLKFDIGKHSDDLYYLHASPVCHEFSKAKHGGKENEMDIKSAKKVAKDLETAMPQVFTVENAPAYLNSKSLKIITSKLEQLGYDWDADVYNSADYGSATSRERCIVRAVKEGTLPSKPAKTDRSNSWDKVTKKYWSSLENAKARSGAAITESTLSAIRNTKKLQKYLNEDGTISVDKPLLILTTTSGHEVTFAEYGKLCPTLTTNCGEAKLILPGEHITFAHPNDNIKQVTPEFMGAIQGLEGYKYGDAKTRAFTIIGNGIPTQLTKAVMGGLLESSYRETHGKELYSSRTTPKEDRAYAPTFYSKMATVIDGIKTEKVGAGGVIPYLKGKGVKDEEIKWSGIQAFLDGKKSLTKAELQEFAKGSMLQIEEKILGEYGETVYTDTETGVATTYEDINSSAEKYKNDKGYDSYNISSDRVGDITVDFYEGEDVVESLTFIKSTHNTKWSGSEYTSQSGTNYREILFKLPGSNYRNIAMERHWGDSGVLAHARIQDFYTENHGNMLFVEEVQSDWHNALEKSEKGISSKEELTLRKRLASLKEKVRKYSGLFTEEAKRIRLESKEELKEIKNQLKNKFGYDFSTINYEEFVPDAPFRSTYTDFVMKRLIREAAEKGYDSIGWTSAQMQEDRWSSEFAEGYRIEYDQDIPKFMKKFGKQFGATVIQDTMGENQTYWVMDITPEMKDSVLYKGQEMYSRRTDDSTDNRTLLANAFEEIATNAEELSKIREYKSKISELNRLQESLESIRRKNSSIPKSERDAYKSEAERIAKKIYYADKSLIELEASEPLKRVIEREREVAIARAKEISNKRVQKYRDDRYKTEIRNKIKSLVTELNRRDFSPKKNRYIPYNLIRPVNELLSSINLDSGRYQSVSDKLAKLKVQYDAMKDDSRYYMSYDPVIAEMIQNLNDEVGDTSIYEMTTEQLNLVYKTLNSIMHTIRDAVKVKSSSIKMNGQELTAPEIAVNLIKETKDAKGIANELIYRYLKAQLRPSTMFERLSGFKKDSMWSKVYKLLNDGQTKEMQIQMESNDIFATIFQNEKYLRSLTDTKNLVDFGLKDEDGNPVKVTRGMMLAIRKALDNDENARHILVGGITIPNLERYYDGKGNDPYGLNSYTVRGIASEGLIELNGRIADAIEDKRIAKEEGNKELAQQIQEEIDYMVSQRNEMMEDVVFMRQELITKINNLLTEDDTKLLALATDYFDKYSKNKLNEVTMEKYGFEKAQVENYLPIHTNKDFRKASFEQIARDVSLENAGFMKDRVKAYNPIYLEDLTDMISSQIDKTAKYVGLMQAVADFQKIYGYTDQSFETSVQNAIRTKFDGVTINYIDNLITDVVGGRIGETTFLDRARGMTAQATLTLNPRVAAAQTASFPTAAAYLGWKPINKALKLGLMKADRDFIKQYTPILQARIDDGGFSEVADIKRMNSMADRTKAKLNFILGWISAMDNATVGRLWYASQFYVDEHYSDIEKGTDEYYRKTAEVFEECVQKTQPNYSVLQRPDILRNPNAAVKMLTMFMTQRLQNNNILYEAVGRYSKYKSDLAKGINGVTKEDLADAKWGVERAVTSRLAAGAMIVSIKFIVDAIMHSMNAYRDDDEELTPDSIFAKLFSNLLESEASNYLGGSEAYSYLYSVLTGERYYGVSLNGVSTISDFIEDSQKLASYAKEGLTSYGDLTEDEKDALSDKLISQLWKLTKDGAVVKGIPLANAEKMFNGFRYHLADIQNGEFGSFEAGVERTKTQEVRRSYKAYLDGDMSKFNSIAIEQTYVTKYIKPMFLEAYRNNDNSTMAKLRKYLNATGLYKKDVVTITQDWIKNSNK